MANLRLAAEQALYEITDMEDLVALAKSRKLDGLYLVVESGSTDNVFLSGQKHPWALTGEFTEANVYDLFARLFTLVTGMRVHLT